MTGAMWFQPKRPGAKRILFHVRSRVGLGHLNRSITVAQMLKAGIPDLELLFLIESGGNLVDAAAFPWILIGQPTAESEACEQMARAVLNAYHPDLVIYETFLHPEVYVPVAEAGPKQVVMASLGAALRNQFRDRLPVVNTLDLLLILQQPQEIIASDHQMLAQYSGRTVFAGPLVRRKTQLGPEELRQKRGLTPNDQVILLTCGGGGYTTARELVENILKASPAILTRYPQAKLVLISGPHYIGDLPQTGAFLCYASKFEPYLTDYFEIASAIVCMAGYSTVNEVAGSGIPAICVPTAESGDQIGTGSMSEYAQSFPNMVVSTTDTHELTQKTIDALGKERDFSAVRAFWQQAQAASQSIVDEIRALLDSADAPIPRIRERVETSSLQPQNSRIQRIIAIMSSKGGVGKSTITALLASALQRQGQRVGIFDADLAAPIIARLFHMEDEPLGYSDEGAAEPPQSKSGVKIFSVHMSDNAEEPLAWRGPMVSSALKQLYAQITWGDLDYLLIDTPPGTADAPLTILQALPLDGVIIVSTPQSAAASPAKKCINLIQQNNQQLLGIVENMTAFLAPNGTSFALYSSNTAEELANIANAPVLADVPWDQHLAILCDEGKVEDYTSGSVEALATRILKDLVS